MKRYNIIISLSIVVLAMIFIVKPVLAQEDTDRLYLYIDAETIIKGYTAEYNQVDPTLWGEFRLAVVPELVTEPIYIDVKKFDDSNLPDPEGLTRVSDYYIYDILRENQADKDPLILQKPFAISVQFNSDNLFRKKVYMWNKPDQTWYALPSSADYDHGYIRAVSHLPFSRIAVFEDTSELEGKASWYRSSKYPYGVASNNYPMGTMLRVRNVDNGKIVDVEVVSTGPFADNRVVDLTLPAFQQIEESWKGLVRVQVWPMANDVRILGVDTITQEPTAISNEPRLQSTAVVAIDTSVNERINDIVYSKNYDTVLPIASLTKLMTAVVFLETETPFDKIVTYEAGDNAIGSKLYVSPGETMTVKDLYFTMLVGSANNATKALVRSTGLSQEEFVQRMNDKAKAWGLEHTNFNDVTGLDVGNVSTVYEVALMAKNAFNNLKILQGTTTWAYGFRTLNTDIPHTIKSTSEGMADSSLFITGMKTGYLDEAGYCFVFKARSSKESDKNIITVVLGADSKNQRDNETTDLMNYSLSQ